MTIGASDSSPDALMLLIDPDAIAVIVSALFGGDPDLPVAPIARDLSPTEIDRCRHGLQDRRGGGQRLRRARLQPALPACRRRSPAPSSHKHVVRDGPAVRIDFSIFSGRSLRPHQPADAAAGLPQASRRHGRRTSRPAAGAGRLGRALRRRGDALVGAARSDDAAVAADARRDRRLPRRPDHRDRCGGAIAARCCRRARRRCSSANSASSDRTTRFASGIPSMPTQDFIDGLLPAEQARANWRRNMSAEQCADERRYPGGAAQPRHRGTARRAARGRRAAPASTLERRCRQCRNTASS